MANACLDDNNPLTISFWATLYFFCPFEFATKNDMSP